MTKREALELKMALNQPFGRWLMRHLKELNESTVSEALVNIPNSHFEQLEREQNFGKAKAFNELIESIPLAIDLLVEKTKEQDE